jgi:hypothetical protein
MIFKGELRKLDPIEHREWMRRMNKRRSRTPQELDKLQKRLNQVFEGEFPKHITEFNMIRNRRQAIMKKYLNH